MKQRQNKSLTMKQTSIEQRTFSLPNDNSLINIVREVKHHQSTDFHQQFLAVDFIFSSEGPTYLRFSWDPDMYDMRPKLINRMMKVYGAKPTDYIPSSLVLNSTGNS